VKLRISLLSALFICLVLPAAAANRIILRPADGVAVETVAGNHRMIVLQKLNERHSPVYLAAAPSTIPVNQVISELLADPAVGNAEEDKKLSVPEIDPSPHLNQSTTAILDQIAGRTLKNFFGQQVPSYYATQAAASQIKLNLAQQKLVQPGKGQVVAIIDTGIDPTHPTLKSSIVPGFDFGHNVAGIPNELKDLSPSVAAVLTQSTTAILDQGSVAKLNQSTTAILDQSTTAILDQSTTAILDKIPAAFGHGTMVAGVVHMAAPFAKIMPLKAFTASGNAQLADILRAIYYASEHGATVINMSFSLSTDSVELTKAVNAALTDGSISVASTGNTGLRAVSFPAAAPKVLGVASVNSLGQRSLFSSFGPGTFISAPGELVITTYPGGHFAAASGTSFSSPLIAGSTALVIHAKLKAGLSDVTTAFSTGRTKTDMGFGVANVLKAVQWGLARR